MTWCSRTTSRFQPYQIWNDISHTRNDGFHQLFSTGDTFSCLFMNSYIFVIFSCDACNCIYISFPLHFFSNIQFLNEFFFIDIHVKNKDNFFFSGDVKYCNKSEIELTRRHFLYAWKKKLSLLQCVQIKVNFLVAFSAVIVTSDSFALQK